jgi:hypothetical protein
MHRCGYADSVEMRAPENLGIFNYEAGEKPTNVGELYISFGNGIPLHEKRISRLINMLFPDASYSEGVKRYYEPIL